MFLEQPHLFNNISVVRHVRPRLVCIRLLLLLLLLAASASVLVPKASSEALRRRLPVIVRFLGWVRQHFVRIGRFLHSDDNITTEKIFYNNNRKL